MPVGGGAARPCHLSWRANGDNLDVALAVNRVLAAGGRAWRLRADDAPFDGGDYLLEFGFPEHGAQQQRVTHDHVRVAHVDLRPQHACAVGELARLHPSERAKSLPASAD